MNVQILSSAEEEIAEAMDYYDEQSLGLGDDFVGEVQKSLKRIQCFPNGAPLFVEDVRRSLLDRFPYGVLYENRGDLIVVFAVMHLKQDPQKWFNRAKLFE